MRRVSGKSGGLLRHALGRTLRPGRPRPDDDRGAVAIIVAVMLTLFIGLAALVVDHGLAADTQRQAQNAADASALAAALVMSQGKPNAQTDAEAAAKQYAAKNFNVTDADWNGCNAPLQNGFQKLSTTTCISYNPGTKAVHVAIPARQVPTVFAGLFGISSQAVASAATAGFGNAGVADCVLCILDRLAGGTGSVRVTGGDVIGDKLDFNNANGSITVTGGGIGFGTSFAAAGSYTPGPPQKVTGFQDPYKGVPLPPLPNTVAGPGSNNCVPGAYTDLDNCTTIAAGTYVITGNKNNKLPVTPAGGVMFFFTCSDAAGKPQYCPTTGADGGTFEAAGNGSFTVTGLNDPTSPYNNFAIFVDPNNTSQQKWAGKATLNVTGIVYAANADPKGGVADKGNGMLNVNGRAVLGRLELDGVNASNLHVTVKGPAPAGSPSALTVIPRLSQ